MAQKAGADYVINPLETDPVQFTKDLTGGRGVDVVFFAIAISKMFEQCYSMLSASGRIIVYSSQHPDDPYPLKLGQIHTLEKEIIGAIDSSRRDIFVALEMMAYGKLNMDLVIAGVYPLANCRDAFEASIVPGTYRVIIRLDE